jgi:hypothetical protein
LAPVVIVAVYRVLAVRLLVGSRVATEPMEVTAPDTGVTPCFKVKLDAVIVAGSIASLKVAVMFLLTTEPAAVSAGSVELTVGAVVSIVAPVVKPHVLSAASALAAMSLKPVVAVAVYAVLAARLLVGAKVAVRPTQVTAPGTGVTPCFRVNVPAVQVAGSMASLKVTVSFPLGATPPVLASPGFVELTVGAVVSPAAGLLLLLLPHPAIRTASSNVMNHSL